MTDTKRPRRKPAEPSRARPTSGSKISRRRAGTTTRSSRPKATSVAASLGTKPFTFELRPDFEHWGRLRFEKGEIVLESKVNARNGWGNLLHECIHAARIALHEQNEDPKIEEFTVRAYEIALGSLLAPWLRGHPFARYRKPAKRKRRSK
jgi:hypothetical protein